ncbi:MAG: carboxynorspermidine decarboxylase, partial [SAR324 cluster bacterium]|nr:carboxynorspermidine decarboxylase [SAR324 cluster bacterium]
SYAPAFSAADIEQLVATSDYLIFNSTSQWHRFRELIPGNISCGLRINPEYSEVAVELYNPCAANSRLGITRRHFPADLDGITGLHFHALCEQNADTLERILSVVEKNFGAEIQQMKWVNFGGGHHITRSDYDLDLLIQLITSFKDRYDVELYLEPGEAIALNCGVLVASVLDIVENDTNIAILDTSAEAHMTDVLAMPYRVEILGADKPGVHPHVYRLAGLTCLAGDVIGDYSFPMKLEPGSKVVFLDMGHYSMVKNNMFNGVQLPAIALRDKNGQINLVRHFGYQDYKNRLS